MSKIYTTLVCFILLATIVLGQEPRLVVPVGHTKYIDRIFVSPGNNKILTFSGDGTIKIWDETTGLMLADLKIPNQQIEFAEVSIDGKLIVTTTNENITNLWQVNTGEIFSRLDDCSTVHFSSDGKRVMGCVGDSLKIWDTKNGNYIRGIETGWHDFSDFSLDGKRIITSYRKGKTNIWNSENGKLITTLIIDSIEIEKASFTKDYKNIITFLDNGILQVWDIETGELANNPIGNVLNKKKDIKFYSYSEEEEKVVFGNYDSLSVWNIKTNTEICRLQHEMPDLFDNAQFIDNGQKLLVTVSYGKFIKIINATNGKLIKKFQTQTEGIFQNLQVTSNNKFLIGSVGNEILEINLHNGEVVKFFQNFSHPIKSAQYNSTGEKIVLVQENLPIQIWDATTGSLLESITQSYTQYAELNKSGTKILTYSSRPYISIIDNQTKKEVLKLLLPTKGFFSSAHFSKDEKRIISNTYDSLTIIWDVASGSPVISLTSSREPSLSPDGKKVIIFNDGLTKVFDIAADTIVRLLDSSGKVISTALFSNDGTKILTTYGKKIRLLDAVTNKIISTIINPTSFSKVDFSEADSTIVTFQDYDNILHIWNINSEKLISSLEGHRQRIVSCSFRPDGKQILTGSEDNTCKIWDVNSGKLIYIFFAIDSTDYFAQIPTGYYQCTSDAAKLLHYVTKDLKVITFEQLDVKYNRPDKVLEAIGNTDTALIKSYRKAYEKRIKKLGIDTTAFRDGYSVPEADFANRDAIEYEQKSETLVLQIKGIDSTYKLDRFNVWINETPLYGQRGISLSNKNSHSFDSTITIELSQGENKIETSITNVNGTESYRMPLLVNYTPAIEQTEKTYFIGIGIDQFTDSKYNLKYSTKDIKDLSKKLKEKYNDIIIDTLFNENVTISNVKALKQKLLQTSVNDKVIISYSGHGMLSKDFDYYLSTYAVNFDKPEENGLPYDELESLLDSIPARKKLMLIDACHSGEVDKDDLVALNATDNKLIKGFKPVAYKNDGHLGLKNSFELMQSLFVNVGKSTGATIISAAAGTQFALEGVDNLPNGVFTYCILEAMNKYPTMKISELKKTVGERVLEITKGLQKPTSRNETIAVDWEVW